MESKIEFTKADESSFDGTAADRYSADEVALVSQHDAKPHVGGWACQVCGFSNGKSALKVNNVDVGHCCLPFIGNLSKQNGNTLLQELENQTNYINSLN